MKLRFRDQPKGRCLECKWNRAGGSGHEEFDCCCPLTHVTDKTCIMKINLIENMNSAYYLGGE